MTRSIELDDLQAAVTEAYRFLGAARTLKSIIEENIVIVAARQSPEPGEYQYLEPSGKANADTFRKSMDLTRALAKLRHP